MVQIIGQAQLLRNLGTAGQHPSVVEMDAIALQALEPMRAETSALAPRVSLKNGVVTKRVLASGRERREYWVSFKRGLAMRIAHLVELGTAPHSLAKGASRRKGLLQHLPPHHPGTAPEPFMTPAFEATKASTLQDYGRLAFATIVAAIPKP